MSVMEPDLILHPILERAVPSLEALVETQRTIAVIKALGAIAPAIVSRSIYYPGAKHLVALLQLLIPGIDLASSLVFPKKASLINVPRMTQQRRYVVVPLRLTKLMLTPG